MIGRIWKLAERALLARQAYKWVMRDWIRLDDLEAAAAVLRTLRFTQNLRPVEVDPPGGRLLVLAPHPDDEVIGPGGTLMMARDRGAQVCVFFLSTGEKRGSIREREAVAVSEHLGWEPVFPDVAVPLTEQLAELIRSRAPQRLFVPFLLDDHPEHRAASLDLLVACESMGNLLDETIEVWAYQVYGVVIPNVIIDVSSAIDRKCDAIARYRSQGAHRDWAHYARGMAAFNSRLKAGAAAAYVETFFVLPLGEYLDLCRQYRDQLQGSR